MASVSQLLALKGHKVHAIGRMATVFDAIERMVAHNVGALLVMEDLVMEDLVMEDLVAEEKVTRAVAENDVAAGVAARGVLGMRPSGILTERDYLRKVALKGRASRTTLVHEIMTRKLISVHPDTAIESCMDLMTRNHIRHLPVFEGEALAGLVSIGDIIKHLAGDRQMQIEQLTAYIQGGEMARC
jgi:CBS domain-containing protein